MNKISKRRKLELAAYAKLKILWLPGKTCVLCGHKDVDVHHAAGRNGIMLLLVQFWYPLCRADHSRLGDNMAEARRLGILCPIGKWNCILDEYKFLKNDLDTIVAMQMKLL